MNQPTQLRRLADVLGSVIYMGRCPDCKTQHMSLNARVGPNRECERCYRRKSTETQR